jgi:hypothetical protein
MFRVNIINTFLLTFLLYIVEAGGDYGRLSVRNVITKLELSVGLEKVKSNLGNYVWKVKDIYY